MAQRSLLPDVVPHDINILANAYSNRPAGRVTKPKNSAIYKITSAFPGVVLESDSSIDERFRNNRQEKKELFNPDDVRRTGGCEHPIRLAGSLSSRLVDTGTGEITTESHSDPRSYAACKTRRSSRCEPCSTLYRHDARHLVLSGLVGGKGIEESIATVPAHFVTLTAPSFGTVHSANGAMCLPRRDAEICPHGIVLCCWQRHDKHDQLSGQAFCKDCYDYTGAVLWNNSASVLWRITRINIDRAIGSICGVPSTGKQKPFKTQYVKVTEFQSRGLIHFHIAIRLDGFDGVLEVGKTSDEIRRAVELISETATDQRFKDTINELISTDQLASAVLAAAVYSAGTSATVTAADDQTISWGNQIDIKPVTPEDVEDESNGDDDRGHDGDSESENAHLNQNTKSRRQVANYISKYATKGSDIDGKLDRRFKTEDDLKYLNVNDHLARMVRTSWQLSRKYPDSKLDRWSHQMGYRGHFMTKSRGWSTTFKALRQARKDHQENLRIASWQALNPDTVELINAKWNYAGMGYRSGIDDEYAQAIREQRRLRKTA